jgi:radical SAM superfamily enzyme YgiQ (UPF0313 family)
MKVLLVATNREVSPYPVAPLGALCVAGAARESGHDVTFLDLGLSTSPQKMVENALAKGRYDAVAFGIRNLDNCWSFAPRLYFDEVKQLADAVRRNFEGPLIVGGTGFSVAPAGWMQRLQPDCGVIGEGERAFPEILSRLEHRQPLEGMPGVLTRTTPINGGVSPTPGVEKLSELPGPAHELCGYARYLKQGGFVGVQTKRGCPFKCVYCIYPQLEGKRYRLRSPDAVVEEIEKVAVRSKLHHFFFVDSVFNDPRDHALTICRKLAKRRLPVRWEAFCNPVGFDSELAHAMAASGCVGVEFGLDVADPKMLRAMGKPFDQSEIKVSLQAAKDAGLPFVLYMLFGGPGETWKDIEDSQKFLASCATPNGVFASFGIRVYEHTPLARLAAREGQVTPGQDLFEAAYYISPHLAEDTERKLDQIARRSPEWTSPADWRRPMVRWAQKLFVFFNVRPQWKYLKGYGQYMR